MKKLVLTVLVLFAFSGIGLASPLLDYSKGSVQFDYTYRPNLNLSGSAEIAGQINPPLSEYGSFNYNRSKDFDGKANLDLGLTIGLGNNWAVQYRQYNPQGTIYSGPIDQLVDISIPANVSADGKIRSDEYNVLYKVSPNAAAFVGIIHSSVGIKAGASGSYNGSSGSVNIPELRSESKNTFHVGVLGSAGLTDKLSAYGVVSFGGNYRNWETGLSYDASKNVQVTVNYRNTKFDKFNLAGASYSTSYADVTLKDLEAKGWGFGLSYRF